MPLNESIDPQHTDDIIECKYCSTNLFEEKEHESKINPIYIIGISALILTIGLFLNFFTAQKNLVEILFLMVAVISGYEIVNNGIRAISKGKFSISFLITVAAIGAFLIGEGAEGASVLFLFYIAEYLEDYAEQRAKKSVGSLIKLAPETAVVKRDGKYIELHAHAVDMDEIVVVKPGEKIPLDGTVINGIS